MAGLKSILHCPIWGIFTVHDPLRAPEHWTKGDERQAQPYPTAGEHSKPPLSAPAQVEPDPQTAEAGRERRGANTQKAICLKTGKTLTENILQHSFSTNRNSHIPWNGLFIIQQLVKKKRFPPPLVLKHMSFSSNKAFTKHMRRNFTKGSVHHCWPCAGLGHLFGARPSWCKPVFMGPLCLGSHAKSHELLLALTFHLVGRDLSICFPGSIALAPPQHLHLIKCCHDPTRAVYTRPFKISSNEE